MNKKFFVTNCEFRDFSSIKLLNETVGLDLEMFCIELKELMEKYKIKEIYPNHRTNAQISRHINDDEIHIYGMYFQSE